jgi:hypothetical protein
MPGSSGREQPPRTSAWCRSPPGCRGRRRRTRIGRGRPRPGQDGPPNTAARRRRLRGRVRSARREVGHLGLGVELHRRKRGPSCGTQDIPIAGGPGSVENCPGSSSILVSPTKAKTVRRWAAITGGTTRTISTAPAITAEWSAQVGYGKTPCNSAAADQPRVVGWACGGFDSAGG